MIINPNWEEQDEKACNTFGSNCVGICDRSIQRVVEGAPDPVRWLVLDASTLTDVDYSAGLAFGGLLDYLDHRAVTFALAGADSQLLDTLDAYDLRDRVPDDRVFGSLQDAVVAFRSAPAVT